MYHHHYLYHPWPVLTATPEHTQATPNNYNALAYDKWLSLIILTNDQWKEIFI